MLIGGRRFRVRKREGLRMTRVLKGEGGRVMGVETRCLLGIKLWEVVHATIELGR